MPFTKDKYLVKEKPALVQWERETRKFLRLLSPRHSHRVSADMVYEGGCSTPIKEDQWQSFHSTIHAIRWSL